jgi:hypothetical protein
MYSELGYAATTRYMFDFAFPMTMLALSLRQPVEVLNSEILASIAIGEVTP